VNVLVVNAGSSSLKLSLIGPGDETIDSHTVERWESGDAGPVGPFVERHDQVGAVAHRVVHGGDRYTTATVIDDDVISGISALTNLAPIHQPRAIAGIEATRSVIGSTIEVACFDTAFHAGMAATNRTYALPGDWRARWPIRRFGFHGLSHAYVARRAAEVTDLPVESIRTISCHLGSGASLCAIAAGRSVDTTMGFTPLEGLVMGTRSGTIDPGAVLWLIQQAGLTPEDVADGLERRSGLLGLSGRSSDMRDVLGGVDAGDQRCDLALAVYVHRLVQSVAAMAASLGGLDTLVFTGGIGENSPRVRAAAGDLLAFLGIRIAGSANDAAKGDADITEPGAVTRTVVVTAREDVQMARETRSLVGS
jgi:acetate kinase